MHEEYLKIAGRILENEVIDLTQKLIRIPSVVRANVADGSEEDVAHFIADQLRAIGLSVTMEYVEPRRPNVIAVLEGQGPGKCLLFEGHTDVVTEGNPADWTYPPFDAVLADGRIYGRGACDTKGNIAAMILATKAIISAGAPFKGRIKLCIPADEEGMMLGIKHFIRQGWADDVDAAIICEPEENNLCITQKGAMRAIVKTQGKMSHGCMPLAGINPITRLAALITELDMYEKREIARLGLHPFLGYPSVTPTILKAPVEGEPQINVVPAAALATLDIRTVPGQDHEAIKRDIQAIFGCLKARDEKFSATIEVIEERPWTETPKDSPVVTALAEAYRAVTGKEVIYNGVPGATDGTFLNYWKNIPIATIGAGNRLIPHQKDEYVDVAELVETAKIYAVAALRFLND